MFTDDWKKSNVLPIHNRDSKNLIKHYGPINLLPFFSKVFERLVFDSLLNYVIQNKQFNDCQSGFIHGKSCVAHFPLLWYFKRIWQGLAQRFMLAGDLLGSVLELLLILILTIYLMKKNQYIKISADNTSIFSKVKDKIVSC